MTVIDHPQKRDDIQGLRGLAVLAVMTYHAGHVLMPGGFAGVDIFFVISGYLITQILLKSHDEDTFSLRDFYRRRIRRLFPALFVVLAAVVAAGFVLLPPKPYKELAFTQFFTTLFLSNFAFERVTDYFDSGAGLRPLLHTWSLAVEEQFYVVYPLCLMLVWRYARRYLWFSLALLLGLSLVSAEWSVHLLAKATFYSPVARAFELLTGALCVGIHRHVTFGERTRRAVSLAGVALLLGSLILLNDGLPFPGLWAVPPCLGAACVLVSRDGWGNRWLAFAPLVFAGDMSYSLYLWHWPLLVYGRMIMGDGPVTIAAIVVVALVVAWLSRRFIEQPVLKGRISRVWLWGGVAMAVSIFLSLTIYTQLGLPQRFNVTEQKAFAAADDFSPDRHHCHLADNKRGDYAKTCVFGAAPIPSVAVWGDSEGVELSSVLGDMPGWRELGIRQITASACPPSLGYTLTFNRACQAHNDDTLAHLISDPRIGTVVLAVNYQRYRDDNPRAMMDGLQRSALALQAAGKHVVMMYPLPVYDLDPPSDAGMAMRWGRDPKAIGMTVAQYQHDNADTIAQLDAFIQAHGLVSFKPTDVLCDALRCHIYTPVDGVLYFNGQHLSLAGVRKVARLITNPMTPDPVK